MKANTRNCKITLLDEVNCQIDNLDGDILKKLKNTYKKRIAGAYYTHAYRLGRWDGTVMYFSIVGKTYINLLDEIILILKQSNYQVDLVDNRVKYIFDLENQLIDENFFAEQVWWSGQIQEGKPIILNQHQVNAVNIFLQNPQSLQEIVTGGGKTLIAAALSKITERYGKSLIIVPSKDLVIQTSSYYKNLGLDCGVYYGSKKEIDKHHTIITWQSLAAILRKYEKGDVTNLSKLLDNVSTLIVDECHLSVGKVNWKMLTGILAKIPLRWGITGTLQKDETENMAMTIGIGRKQGKVAARELQNLGILSNCSVKVVRIDEIVKYKGYEDEIAHLLSDEVRFKYIKNIIMDIQKSGNTLILVSNIAPGEMLYELISADTDDVVFISGRTHLEERMKEYNAIKQNNNKIIIATYGVAAIGIDIPRLFNVVLLEPGKSFVRVIQSIGRGIRKADDKSFVQIWDITSTAKYSQKHLTQRLKFYKEVEYPYIIKDVSIT